MSAEKNLKAVKAFLNQGDLNVISEQATFQDFTQQETIQGPEAISQMIYNFYNINFPGAEAEFTNTVAGERSVVMEFTFRGVHNGELWGIIPTGRAVEIPMCVVYDVEEGIIQRGRLYYDGATMARQLGLKTLV
jgi:predicted ester cyclase